MVAFQKTACLALHDNASVTTPIMFHCDRTTDHGDCNTHVIVPLIELFVLSRRVLAILTSTPPTRVLANAYYLPNHCQVSAHALPDLIDFSSQVKAYGTQLQKQCPLPCVVVQYRSGHDWKRHDGAFRGAWVSSGKINHTIATLAPTHSCLLMTPEHVPSPIQCKRILHNHTHHGSLRFMGELFVASRASMFLYNRHSTSIHIVRRMSMQRPTNNRVDLVPL